MITRQHNQVGIQMHCFSRNGEIRITASRLFADLRRRPLMHMQVHFRVAINKLANDRRQCIARLSVCCGNI